MALRSQRNDLKVSRYQVERSGTPVLLVKIGEGRFSNKTRCRT
jgi:hypothetical protein